MLTEDDCSGCCVGEPTLVASSLTKCLLDPDSVIELQAAARVIQLVGNGSRRDSRHTLDVDRRRFWGSRLSPNTGDGLDGD